LSNATSPLPTNSNSSASIGSSGSHHHSIYAKDHFNGKNSKYHGGYCDYSDYKSNVNSVGSSATTLRLNGKNPFSGLGYNVKNRKI